ncbi:hypothetical protein DPEC_G00174790 [Dallia pectoralis]|uniref:Uncharacterized protein n=1 Tax=Dallia pectoralis TaxID=75939 RepID=A0ACC2GEK4_DALPE|nr:hypothetical protein DPEC_G00174790 [Dallia pectoralis]
MERDRIAALKRSFEVEDVDSRRAPNNASPRPVMSPTSIYYRELGAGNQNNGSVSKGIMGGGGSRTPDPISRGRTELSIDISSKQVDPTSPGSLRFVTKRPEVLGHTKTPDMGHKREVTFAKTSQEAVIRGGPRTPELPNHPRKIDAPGAADGPAGRTTPGIGVTKVPEPTGNGKNHDNHHVSVHHPHHPNPHHNAIVTTIRSSSPSHGGRANSPKPDSEYELYLTHA